MDFEHAEHTLETIRTLMERSQRYEHISGYSGLVAGSVVLLGCGVLEVNCLTFGPQGNFALVWDVAFTVALTAHVTLTFARARRRDEPAWSRQAKTVYLALLPSFVASLSVTVLLWRLERLDLLPALWLLLYGCGVLATSFFAPRAILVLGASCLVMGATSLVADWGHPLLTMGVGFGVTHVAYGTGVLVAESRERRARALWAEVNTLCKHLEEQP
jgi:hypothetical protein